MPQVRVRDLRYVATPRPKSPRTGRRCPWLPLAVRLRARLTQAVGLGCGGSPRWRYRAPPLT
jgi:hypothetical protein